MNKMVNICGIPHTIIENEDVFDSDGTHLGQIEYSKCIIRLNKDISEAHKKETLCHEMVHGILFHIGYTELNQDEKFVQAFGNAIYQAFDIKEIKQNDIEPE